MGLRRITVIGAGVALVSAWVVPLAGFSLIPTLTGSDPYFAPMGIEDLGWQDDPSELAQGAPWDLQADIAQHSSVYGQETLDSPVTNLQSLSVARGMAELGGVGIVVSQGSASWISGQASEIDGKALGLGYGWALGAGFSGGVSLWQANFAQNGRDDWQQNLMGLGGRWSGLGQQLAVSGLWSKDGLVRPTDVALGGGLGGAWTYGATARLDASGMLDSIVLVGWGPFRVYHRGQRLFSPGLGLVIERPAWALKLFADLVEEGPVTARLVFQWHGFHWDNFVGATDAQYLTGWRSWAPPAPPAAAATAADLGNSPPAIPDVDPAPAPPVSSTKIK